MINFLIQNNIIIVFILICGIGTKPRDCHSKNTLTTKLPSKLYNFWTGEMALRLRVRTAPCRTLEEGRDTSHRDFKCLLQLFQQ